MRFSKLFIAFMFVLASADTARAQAMRDYWSAMYFSDHGGTLEFLDLNSVTQGSRQGSLRFWSTTAYERPWPLPAGAGRVRALVSLQEVDCQTSQQRTLQVTAYDRSGTSLHTLAEPSEWRYAIPDSIAWFSVQLACDGTNPSGSPFLHVGHIANVLSTADSSFRNLQAARERAPQ